MSALACPNHVPPSPAAVAERCYASAYQALADGDLDNALGLFGILALLSAKDERAWIGLATVCERRENWDAAAGLYGVGSGFAPRSAWCHFGRGRALNRIGERALALRELDLAEQATSDVALLDAIEEERNPS
jgi:tetratricopeptide (TPR) repeat protein